MNDTTCTKCATLVGGCPTPDECGLLPDEIEVDSVSAYACPECTLLMRRTEENLYYCVTSACRLYQVYFRPARVTLQRA